MTGENQRFYASDLTTAAFDVVLAFSLPRVHSCGNSQPFGFHLFERPTIAVECCFLACEVSPSDHSQIYVPRIDVDAQTEALREFGGHHRCTGTEERIVDRVNCASCDSRSAAASTRPASAFRARSLSGRGRRPSD